MVLPLTLVILSGATGLIYQVTWQKYLSTLLGSHASAVAAVLTLFFLFLSAGYALFGRFAQRIMKNQLALYGLIELAIGLYALYSPFLFEGMFNFFMSSPLKGGDLTFALALCAAFIAIPTVLMGGTIPVLTQALSKNFSVSSRTHALIYGLNTIGAVTGCVAGGFYLHEKFGLEGALIVAGNLNILIAIASFLLIRYTKQTFEGPPPEADSGESMSTTTMACLFVISLLSGYYTFSLEKIVIRMAGVALGSTTYTYTIIVGAFILAIGVGSLILTFNRRFERPEVFAIVQLGALISVIWLYHSVPNWPDYFYRLRSVFASHPLNFELYWMSVFVFFTVVLLIPVGLIGTNLPLLFGILRGKNIALSRTVGRLYAINCFGAAVGAAFGGYWVFHFFNGAQAYKILTWAIAIATAIGIGVLFKNKIRIALWGVVVVVITAFQISKPWDPANFSPGLFLWKQLAFGEKDFGKMTKDLRESAGRVIFDRFDPNTFVTVMEKDDQEKSYTLLVNGKPDATTAGDARTRAYASITPMMINPNPVKRAFIVGLGAGLSTAILTKFPEVEQVDVAEISEGVVQSLPFFEEFNFDLKQRMSRVDIEVNDAYRALMSRGTYDLIICEPSNPWVAGIDKLYSVEFLSEGYKHLTEDGLYVQWFPVGGIDAKTFAIILRTFRSVFPHVVVFTAGGALTIVASKKELRPDPHVSQQRFDQTEEILSKFDVHSPYHSWFKQILTPAMVEAIIVDVEEVNSIFSPILEFRAGRAHFSSEAFHLTTMIQMALPLPLPENFGGTAFMGDEHVASAPRRVFKDLMDKFVPMSPALLGVRLFALASAHPERSDIFKKEFKGYEDYLWLMNSSKISPEDSKKLSTQLVRYRNLVSINKRPRFKPLAELVDKPCAGTVSETCLENRRLALLNLGSSKVVEKLSKYPISKKNEAQGAEINAEWAKLKADYQRLGAF